MHPDTTKLHEMLVSRIKPETVFNDHCGDQKVDFTRASSHNIWCVFHDEVNAPSLSLTEEGKFHCHSAGCEVCGRDIVQFIEKLHQVRQHAALRYLYTKYIRPLIDERINDGFHANLVHTPEMMTWLLESRGVTRESVDRFHLGFDNRRITIPIRDEFGQLVNIRRYDWTKREQVKMLPYMAGYGTVTLYPYTTMRFDDIILCEGEFDCILLNQHGFKAITTTGGVGAWKEEWSSLFSGKKVTICYDVNDPQDAGQRCARKRSEQLAPFAREVKILKLPLKDAGGDVTDFFVKHGLPVSDFTNLIKGSPTTSKTSGQTVKAIRSFEGVIYEVPLSEASSATYYEKRIRMNCTVAGKDLAPYVPPKDIKVVCTEGGCAAANGCPFDSKTSALDMKKDPRWTLQLIDCHHRTLMHNIKSIAKVSPDCPAEFAIQSAFNVENVQLIPEIDFSITGAPYVMRNAYYVGHGLKCNQTYQFEGITIPDKKQYAVHILTKATPAQSAIESFELTPQIQQQLSVFQTKDIGEKLLDIYFHLATNATRIFRRPDLHQAVDLVFHSPLQFRFNNELVHKGWLEALVIGDTRTGKGYVAEGLIRHYRLGEIASAENCTFAGLVGGMQQLNNRWMITWGKIPLNDGRLVVIDEISALSVDEIQRMSRVRSEGIAEVTKIHTERTNARTRLVWLTNPRSGDAMNTYNTGVEAVRELIGRNEDIARFDYAVAVATDEVPSSVINRSSTKRIASPYTGEACHNLILWVWSRAVDQVVFTPEATTQILMLAKELGRRYTPAIPLIQAENIRIKLAKIAAAVAGRTFNCTPDGKCILVTEACVNAAHNFLNACYTKPSMGYNAFSDAVLDRDALKDEASLDTLVDNLSTHALDFVEGCLEQSQLTIPDIADYAGTDREQAQHLVGTLVRQRAIKKNGTFYTKKPTFIEYLRRRRAHYLKTGPPKPHF